MCGIVGVAGTFVPGLVEAMNSEQVHRGPDSAGLLVEASRLVALGMTRLAIQDLADGSQPMTDLSGRYTIVFNGEIFNSAELRELLEARGVNFSTSHSDTETLLLLYRELGVDMVSRLVGMFAFVIYDRKRRELFGARDGAGIKPFYYIRTGKNFFFASELKSLRHVGDKSRDINAKAVYDFVSLNFIPSPSTVYQGISKLEPGHYFRFSIDSGKYCSASFWSPTVGDSSIVSFAEAVSKVRLGLEQAVHRWLVSDVPVAFSLSGGLDSAALVGMAAMNASEPLETFSLGFSETTELDELALARQVAQKWSTSHHEIRINSGDLLHYLGEMAWHLDEPYAGGLPSWFVFKEMSNQFKVGVVGTGGDELFGNYRRWLPFEDVLSGFSRYVSHILRQNSIQDILRFPNSVKYRLNAYDSRKRQLFAPGFVSGLAPTEDFYEKYFEASSASPRNLAIELGFRFQLPDEFLQMTDRFSMAHSVEARTPFLDQRLISEVFSIKDQIRTNRENPKALLARAVRDLVPADIIKAPKRGFVVPEGDWLRGALKGDLREVFSPEFIRNQGIFSATIYERVLPRFLAGNRNLDALVWNLFMFQVWFRLHRM